MQARIDASIDTGTQWVRATSRPRRAECIGVRALCASTSPHSRARVLACASTGGWNCMILRTRATCAGRREGAGVEGPRDVGAPAQSGAFVRRAALSDLHGCVVAPVLVCLRGGTIALVSRLLIRARTHAVRAGGGHRGGVVRRRTAHGGGTRRRRRGGCVVALAWLASLTYTWSRLQFRLRRRGILRRLSAACSPRAHSAVCSRVCVSMCARTVARAVYVKCAPCTCDLPLAKRLDNKHAGESVNLRQRFSNAHTQTHTQTHMQSCI